MVSVLYEYLHVSVNCWQDRISYERQCISKVPLLLNTSMSECLTAISIWVIVQLFMNCYMCLYMADLREGLVTVST